MNAWVVEEGGVALRQLRNPWLDAGRGIALLLMALFHLQVDRVDFFAQSGDYRQGVWWLAGKTSVLLFLFLAGAVAKNDHVFTQRNVRLGAAAFLVSGVTWIVIPEAYVRFGILHLLAVAGCLSGLFALLPTRQLIGVVLALAMTAFLPASSWLFGPETPEATLDHYPLFPWLGVYIAGMAAARFNLTSWRIRQPLPLLLKPVAGLGRRTLLIYLLHQPILLLILFIWYQ